MKIVHTEMELRMSGIERFSQAVRRVRQHAQARRVRLALYAAAFLVGILVVSLLLR